MGHFLLIFLCLGAGMMLKALPQIPRNSQTVWNSYLIYLALPALTLLQLHRLNWTFALLLPASMPWLNFLFAWWLFARLARKFGWRRQTTGALILTAGLGNTSFVGFPLLEALLGPHALGTAVVVDQLGSFPVMSTLGVFVANRYASEKKNSGVPWRKLLQFPPFLAMLLALAFIPWEFPKPLEEALMRLGDTLVPIALVSVGFQMAWNPIAFARCRKALGWGLVVKMLLFPGCLAILYSLLNQRGISVRITLLEAAMAPMITGYLLAAEARLDEELAALMIHIGIPLSLASVPIWNFLLSHFF